MFDLNRSNNPLLRSGTSDPSISICVVSKLLESIAHRQKSKFIEDNDLYSRQSGFRKRHSSHAALISIVDDFHKTVDNENITPPTIT